jgi:ubiquinol-cytochrome c reductase iron-sulfur subunit
MTDRRAFVAFSAAALVAGRARSAEAGYPIVASWGEPIDVGAIRPGDWRIATVAGDPIFLRRRTAAEIAAARATPLAQLPDPARDEARAPGGEWIVVSGLCTHANCQVQAGLGPYAGWQCFCHGSIYDLSGRVRSGPAKRNLPIVSHRFSGGAMTLTPVSTARGTDLPFSLSTITFTPV